MPRRSLLPVPVLLLLAALAPSAATRADDPPVDSAGVIVIRRCDVDYLRASAIGPALAGMGATTILQDCLVRRGDRVEAGQVLGRVMDQELRAELELKIAQAETDIDIRVSEAKLAQAVNKLQRSETLQKRVYVSVEELKAHELEATTARLEVEQARLRRKMAEIERRRTEVMIKARECVAPHAGMVVEVLKNQGEMVGPTESLFRVVDDTRLRVTGRVNLADYWRVKVGQRVRVWPELDGEDLAVERECFEGRVVFLDSRIDPESRTATVITEVANRERMLASGLEARMEILPGNPGAAAEPENDPTAARPASRPNEPAPRASPLSPARAVTTGALPREAIRDR